MAKQGNWSSCSHGNHEASNIHHSTIHRRIHSNVILTSTSSARFTPPFCLPGQLGKHQRLLYPGSKTAATYANTTMATPLMPAVDRAPALTTRPSSSPPLRHMWQFSANIHTSPHSITWPAAFFDRVAGDQWSNTRRSSFRTPLYSVRDHARSGAFLPSEVTIGLGLPKALRRCTRCLCYQPGCLRSSFDPMTSKRACSMSIICKVCLVLYHSFIYS